MHPSVRVFLEELGDGAFGRGRFEKFEVGFADVEESGADLLAGHLFNLLALQAEGLLVEGNGFLQRTHRNAKVVNALQHGLIVVLPRTAGKNKFG
jgi:hypothetical protein